ncbi:MAG: ABC transporter permease subunit [Phycisphaera sp.]|nr:ABC transporter permease subunit [Phycisphaera sp.]
MTTTTPSTTTATPAPTPAKGAARGLSSSATKRLLIEVICYLAAGVVILGLGLLDATSDLTFWPKAGLMTLAIALVAAGLLSQAPRRVIAMRELRSYFYSPVGYVVMFLYTLIAGMFFVLFVFDGGGPASMRPLFESLVWVMIAICPAISMRLFAEELRSGTIETLMTSPVTDTQVVIGKWLGAVAFFATLCLPTVACVVALAWKADPDYGPIYTGYLGLLLVASLYLAIGALGSVLTRNQIIAYFISAFIILIISVVAQFLPEYLSPSLGKAVAYINVYGQYLDFSKGLIDTSHFVYFFSITGFFLVVTVKALESRKWR